MNTDTLDIVALTELELSIGCTILGYHNKARELRADGRRACCGIEETESYDSICELFMTNPEDFVYSRLECDLDILLDNVRSLMG